MVIILSNCTAVSEPEDTVDSRPADFVAVDQNIIATEVRYFTADNFVGEPVDGYQAPTIYMTASAYEALLAVSDDLSIFGLGLKVFDEQSH